MYYIGIDDTDILDSPGTGHHAREIAAALAADLPVCGVIRHQLSTDPRVPCTKRNSSAAILIGTDDTNPDWLLGQVRGMLEQQFQPGSDPGLCVARDVPPEIIAFGLRAKQELVTQAEARALAARFGVRLLGLGGTEDGVIGALAAVGLAASGEDGRYVAIGGLRELAGLQPVSALHAAGIPCVQDTTGRAVEEGLVSTTKLRPARRGGGPVAVVERIEDTWQPLKLD